MLLSSREALCRTWKNQRFGAGSKDASRKGRAGSPAKAALDPELLAKPNSNVEPNSKTKPMLDSKPAEANA